MLCCCSRQVRGVQSKGASLSCGNGALCCLALLLFTPVCEAANLSWSGRTKLIALSAKCSVFACVFACEFAGFVSPQTLPLFAFPSAPLSLSTSGSPAAEPLAVDLNRPFHWLAPATVTGLLLQEPSLLGSEDPVCTSVSPSNINCPAAASFFHYTPHTFGGRCQNCHLHSVSTTTTANTQHAAPPICGRSGCCCGGHPYYRHF